MSKVFRIHKNAANNNDWFQSSVITFEYFEIDEYKTEERLRKLESESITKFNNDTVLWKYLDFSKFIDLLESKKLHFTRLDNFFDKNEGAYPPADFERFVKMDYNNSIDKKTLSRLIDISVRLGNYASCWHMNEMENYGMWKSYIQSFEGIAIKTTVGKLISSIDKKSSSIIFGNVEYVDFASLDMKKYYENNLNNGIKTMPIPSFFKRKPFAFEQEFRAVIYREISWGKTVKEKDLEKFIENAKLFYQVPLHLEELMECIYIHPEAPEWFDQLVHKIITRYSIKTAIKKSEI